LKQIIEMKEINPLSAGVSVVICCHNSSVRLPETLRHLAAQIVRKDTPWELVVVDNASTDETADTARRIWAERETAPLRVIPEPRLGLSYARERAFHDARYEFIVFVDDDNWLCEDWVQTVADLMVEHPEVAACGGVSEAVCEIPPPSWFDRCSLLYAISPEIWTGGDITTSRGMLWGAGLTIRKSAWQQLVDNQFRSQLVGRKGKSLTAGEDAELCLALRLADWRIWYEPKLRLRHFLPAGRLTWSYLRRLHRGSGRASVGLDPYFFSLRMTENPSAPRHEHFWLWQVAASLKRLVFRGDRLVRALLTPCEGDWEVLKLEEQIGRLLELLHFGTRYGQNYRFVEGARFKWKRSLTPIDVVSR
jgi:glycosyltransferase involved in cell wall biosynthesis